MYRIFSVLPLLALYSLSLKANGADEVLDTIIQKQLPLASLVYENRQGGQDEKSFETEGLIGLYHPNTATQERGTIVIAHDLSQHFAGAGFIQQAHQHWSAKGWHVMSVFLPDMPDSIVNADKINPSDRQKEDLLKYKQNAFDQLSKAFSHMRQLNVGPIVLVVQRQSGEVLTGLVHSEQSQPDGIVLIDVMPSTSQERNALAKQISELSPAILDIFTLKQQRLSSVFAWRQKSSEMKAHLYRQINLSSQISSKRHQQVLIETIEGWLRRLSTNSLHLSYVLP